MKLKYVIYALIVLGIAYLIYYRISANKKIAEDGAGPGKGKGGSSKGLQVDGIVVQASDFTNDLDVTGTLEANEAVELRSEVSGLVTSINFKEGANVSRGQLLVKINDRDIQAQLQEALTKQKLSATNENRSKQLLEKGAISQEEYDTSLADLQSLKAQTQLIRAQLAKTSIYAPFSGKIGLRSISVGGYLTPSTLIANLSSINPLKISFSVPEKYIGQIKLNSEISFTTDGYNKKFTGSVFAIEPGINTQTRTLQIKALVPNAGNELRPGSFAKIKLALSTQKNALLIPNEAIIPVLKGKTVFITKDGKAQQVPVEAGTRTADHIVITSGLNIGDTVLTTGAMALKQDAPVKVSVVKNKAAL
ncbi:efflux RND transporter periplasmic adaptor subunit [Pedobacter heparinus]|uniref:Efflux transporter, RND family, MFP subunit n=1 Tax=Pedobacter heparinus (strain ATCC 13125 / DSM 2366 / CIP 104194 / JCM 7457 / NBRC 12017 / NCIMB 9290 / NRRL B-14731 / HIM 762-3) TaxID=485917 RepID=C6XUD3_PEDHD|nr:efflux RND transporter periplasmic adaptor subunit [Pedobacter heparinus]ACU05926.1 efflux transporter, RND family, MFP subunit [Pedobacter heparinus DSM 2366]